MRMMFVVVVAMPMAAMASAPAPHCAGDPVWDAAAQAWESGSRERLEIAVAHYIESGCRVSTQARTGRFQVDCTDVPCSVESDQPGPSPVAGNPVGPGGIGRHQGSRLVGIPEDVTSQIYLPVPPAPRTAPVTDGLCSCASSAIRIGGTTTCSYVGPIERILWSIDEGGVLDGSLNIVGELHSAPGVRSATVVGRAPGALNVRWQPDMLCDVVAVVADPPGPPPPDPPSRIERVLTSGAFWGGVAATIAGVSVAMSQRGGDEGSGIR